MTGWYFVLENLTQKINEHGVDINFFFSWDVFVSKLASELGFVSDAAQNFVKNRPPQENVCPESCPHWFVEGPLLIPYYIQNRLDNGSAISINDYLCDWMPSTTLA